MISVCIPTYNCADTIKDTIQDVLDQTYQDFEIIISDDHSTDNLEEVLKPFNEDLRIKIFWNKSKQLGCGGNEEKCKNLANGEFIFFLPGKARISKHALALTWTAFQDPEVGAVTRLYYWFGKDLNHAVRAKQRHSKQDFVAILDTLDNSGGLAFRKKFILLPFNDTPFVEFTYPFVDIMRRHKVAHLDEYTMACPAFKHSHSQDSYIYAQSPMKNWIDMLETVYPKIRNEMVEKFIARNYIGLVQIRNYGTYGQYLRELWYLIKYRWQNLFNLMFWFWVLVTQLPPFILKWLVKKSKELRKLNVSLIDTT